MNLTLGARPVEDTAASEISEPGDEGRPLVDLADAVALGAVAVVALTAWAALALAQAGWFTWWLPPLIALVVAGAVAVRGRRSVHLVVRPVVLGVVGVGLIASAAWFLPGQPYAYGDKDPGLYVLHGAAIEREGSVHVPDEVRAVDPDTRLLAPGARFPGIWIEGDPDAVTPQFYHLYPSLLAVAVGLGDVPASFHVNPLLAALSVVTLGLAVRRVAGSPAGALAVALLGANMLQVWQAKFPTTEILTQLLAAGALLGLAIAARTGARFAAGVAGLLVGLAFLARPDGLIAVLLGLGVAAVVWVVRPGDRRVVAFLVGLGVTLPHSLLNAYDLRAGYSQANDLPPLWLVVAATSLVVASALAVAAARQRSITLDRLLDPSGGHWPRVAPRAAVAGALGFAALLAFFWQRHKWGPIFFDYNGLEVRSYDELNLVRLTYYWPIRAVALSVLGVLALGFFRRRSSAWTVGLVLLPTLPVYLWAAKNSPRLMWWGRRFVPLALPALVVLAAIGAAWLLTRSPWWLRIPAALLVGSIVVETAAASWPLRDHREFAGSLSFSEDLADLAGDGVVLWEPHTPNDIFSVNRNVPSVLWLVHDVPVAYLDPDDPSAAIDTARTVRPGGPTLVVVEDGVPPPTLVDELEVVLERTVTFPYWEEAIEERPDEAVSISRSIVVYEHRPRST